MTGECLLRRMKTVEILIITRKSRLDIVIDDKLLMYLVELFSRPAFPLRSLPRWLADRAEGMLGGTSSKAPTPPT